MVAITTNDLKTGITLDLKEGLLQVIDFQHVKPGKGPAFVRTTLKNLTTKAVIDKTFRAGEKVERAVIDNREMQYLYREGANFVFMDQESFEQMQVEDQVVGEVASFLMEGSQVVIKMHGPEIVDIEIPPSVTLTVKDTEPGMKGDRVSGATKPATLKTGLVIQVPLFISPGEEVKVDTRTGEYMSRQNE